VLAAEQISKAYRGTHVLQGVSLHLRRGETVGLLGPNGAGKTTLFSILAGMLAPDRGRITLDGVDITRLPMFARARRGMAYLPQEPSVFKGLTIEQNILLMIETFEPKAPRQRAIAERMLRQFKLEAVRRTPAGQVSGGERRRCEIARAVAGAPSFILLDEPFAGVDPIAVGDIRALVRQLTGRGIGVLITDHNVREALNLVDRAYIIDSGRVLMQGTAAAVIADPAVRQVYLGDSFRL
jgi:lipopolysaccharide export system ATP-binding protein